MSATPHTIVMSTPLPHERKKRAHWLTITSVVWLLFLSVVVASIALSHNKLKISVAGTEARPDVKRLEARIGELSRRLTSDIDARQAADEERIGAVRTALDARLLKLEARASADEALADEQKKLAERMNAQEAAQAAAARSRTLTPAVTLSNTSKPVPTPPFQVVGVELRHGERFLLTLSPNARSIADTRLLRVGERIGDWMLQSIEPDAAVFHVAGQVKRVPVPGGRAP